MSWGLRRTRRERTRPRRRRAPKRKTEEAGEEAGGRRARRQSEAARRPTRNTEAASKVASKASRQTKKKAASGPAHEEGQRKMSATENRHGSNGAGRIRIASQREGWAGGFHQDAEDHCGRGGDAQGASRSTSGSCGRPRSSTRTTSRTRRGWAMWCAFARRGR